MTPYLTLYHHHGSPASRRVRQTTGHLGIHVNLVDFEGRGIDRTMMKEPVLDISNTKQIVTLTGSETIVDYLETVAHFLR